MLPIATQNAPMGSCHHSPFCALGWTPGDCSTSANVNSTRWKWGRDRAARPLTSDSCALNLCCFSGLTLPSSAALAGATSTLGSLVGTLKGSCLLGSPAVALSTLPVGGNEPWVIHTAPWTSTQHGSGTRKLGPWPQLVILLRDQK